MSKKKNVAPKPAKNRNHKIILGIILALSFLIFTRSISHDFMLGWDDGLYLDDPTVKEFSLSETGKIFSTYHLGMYQPLGVLTLALNHALAGTSATLFHFTNLLLHVLNVWLVYLVMFRLTRRQNFSLVIAALMAIHPMHVEAVSWVSARSTLLFTTFYLLSLLFYTRFIREKRWKFYGITLLFFVLSLFSKSMAVTLPLVLLLLDWREFHKINLRMVLEKVPFLALSVIFGIVAIDASASMGHISELTHDYSLIDRFFLLTYGIWFYLYKLLLPINLSAIYSYPFIDTGILPLEYYLSAGVILLVVASIIIWKKKRATLLFGFLFFLITIAPVLPFYWSRIFIVGERYSYLTYLGLYWMLAEAFLFLYEHRSSLLERIRPALTVVAGIFLVFLMVSTYSRQKVWQDSFALLTDVIDHSDEDWNLAAGFFYRGNFMEMAGEPESAMSDYNLALKYNEGYAMAYNNRGILYGMQGEFENALNDFNKTIELDPGYSNAWHNRGLAHFQLKQPDLACDDWKKAKDLGFAKAQEMLNKYCH